VKFGQIEVVKWNHAPYWRVVITHYSGLKETLRLALDPDFTHAQVANWVMENKYPLSIRGPYLQQETETAIRTALLFEEVS
jgi:hypothetical protein